MFGKIFKKNKKNPPSTSSHSSSQASPKDLFYSRGNERAQNNDFNGAVIMYDEALKLAPTDTAILLSRSFAHMMSAPPRLDLALQDADAVIQHSPTSSQGWLQKGEALLRLGDLKAAEESFLNAAGFAQGVDRFTAQRSLADVRSRRSLPSSTAESSTKPTPQLPSPGPTMQALAPAKPLSQSPAPEPTLHSTPQVVTSVPPPRPTPGPSVQSTSQVATSIQPLQTPTPGPSQTTSQPGPSTGTASSSVSPTLPNVQNPVISWGGLNQGRVPPTNSPQASQTPASSQPPVSEEAPPGYTPSLTNPNATIRSLSQGAVLTQLTQLQTTFAATNKGSLSIRPYTCTGRIDAVKLVYVGMTQLELTARELGTPTYLHPTFRYMAVDAISYPGSTFLDMDCESSGFYEGKLPGTVTISGYSEEYRAHQLSRNPLLNLILEGNSALPTMALDKIVDRIRLLQRQPTLEDNDALREILGLSQITALQNGFHSNRQRQIEAICMGLNRSIYDAPTRFIDFSKARTLSNNTLGTAAQGIGLQHFLYQILLGAELLIRLRKEPITISYAALIGDAISALIVVSAAWMENVTIQGTRNVASSSTVTPPPSSLYVLVAAEHHRQAEGLIRFGELMTWPYMDEARNYTENAYQDLITGRQAVGFDVCDWLFGLILPGKIFRHRIMACLIYASPSVRSLGAAPFYDCGLAVKNKSYWPKRSVLGRVLGGLKNPRSVCGWIGPVPAPEQGPSGWIRINARSVDIPVPVNATETSLESLGFGDCGSETPEETLQSIADPNEWIQASPPPRLVNDPSRSVFKGIYLSELPNITTTTTSGVTITDKDYRASLDFEVNGVRTRYTLYSNPVFVCAPPCVGRHTLHRRQVETYLKHVFKVADLKEADAPSDVLVIIDATGQGEEVVARAWCAERARHAIIRKGEDCCFACATRATVGRTGLEFNVLIWSK